MENDITLQGAILRLENRVCILENRFWEAMQNLTKEITELATLAKQPDILLKNNQEDICNVQVNLNNLTRCVKELETFKTQSLTILRVLGVLFGSSTVANIILLLYWIHKTFM